MKRQPTEEELRQAGPIAPADSVIAIDGPAGSGKSTTAKALARRLRLTYIDTGAMYRALTFAALDAGVDPADGPALARMLEGADLRLKPGEKESQVFWNGRDVSQAIRSGDIDENVSAVSAHGVVRKQMVQRQRALARSGGVVMEGRDIGSVVFPLATTKIYLDASPEARAERRWRQFRERGQDVDRGEVLADLIERDRRDSGRKESPLTISPDALVLDSSSWTLDRQLDEAALACRVNPWLDARTDWDADAAWLRLPTKYRLIYGFLGQLADRFGERVIGRPQATLPPGTIVASNHISLFDPPMVGAHFNRGPLRTLAKKELFFGPLGAAFFRWMDSIPINRRGYDKDAFETARDALDRGQNLFIFPEGTRRIPGKLGPIKGGLGILAQETGAPILPVFVRGTCALRFGGNPQSPLEVRYGPIVRLHALDRLKRDYDRKDVTIRIGAMYLAIMEELQARSFADCPESDFERAVRVKVMRKRRRKNPFG